MTCDSPPASSCTSPTSLRSYASGTCSAATCSYEPIDTPCVCSNGACAPHDHWSTGIPLPTAKSYPAVTTGIDGRVYVFGGYLGTNSLGNVDDAETFAPGSNAWASLPSLPSEVSAAGAATTADGKMYVVGGSHISGNSFPTAQVLVFDPSTSTWTETSSLGTARSFPAVTRGADGRVYAIGGRDGSGNAMTSSESFDPAGTSWTKIPSLPAVRTCAAAVLGRDGRIYVLGGGTNDNRVFAYDPATTSWTVPGSLATDHTCVGAALGPDGRIYVPDATTEIFDPSTGTATTGMGFPTSQSVFGVAAAGDGRIYTVGGNANGDVTDLVQVYTP